MSYTVTHLVPSLLIQIHSLMVPKQLWHCQIFDLSWSQCHIFGPLNHFHCLCQWGQGVPLSYIWADVSWCLLLQSTIVLWGANILWIAYGLFHQNVGNKIVGHRVVLVHIIVYLEWGFGLGQNRIMLFLEYKVDLLWVIDNLSILRESCEHFLHILEKLIKWHGSLILVNEQGLECICFFDPHRLVTFAPILSQ